MAPADTWLFVFSHPNHEIAVYGHLQRLRPRLLFLTDGGGPQRVAETRAGLQRLGLLQQADFLDRPEAALYAALLAGDLGFYRRLVSEVAAVIAAHRPSDLAADGVEFYNPVHDMTLPIAVAALRQAGHRARLHEVPLIFERQDQGGYGVQCPLGGGARRIELEPAEWQAKWQAWTETYGELRGQLGTVVAAQPRAALASEALHPARDPLRRPGAGERLRYEARGRLLQQQGEVAEVITLAGHVQPLVKSLLAA